MMPVKPLSQEMFFVFLKQFYLPWGGIGFLQYSSLTSHNLRLERGGGERIFLSCAVFLITQVFLKIYRQSIHQIEAEYHSYLLASMTLYNSRELELKVVKEI